MNWLPLAHALGMDRAPRPVEPSVVCYCHRIYTRAQWRNVLWQRDWRAARNPDGKRIRRTR